MFGALLLPGNGNTGEIQRLIINRCQPPSFFVICIEIGKLLPEESRLQFIQAGIHAGESTDMAFFPAILAQQAEPFGQSGVVGDDYAAITQRAEVLGRVETETAQVAPGTHAPALVERPVSLGAVLDHTQVVVAGDGRDGTKAGRVAV